MGDLRVLAPSKLGFLEQLEDDTPYLIEFPNSADPAGGAMYEVLLHDRGYWRSPGDIAYERGGSLTVREAGYKVVGKFDVRPPAAATPRAAAPAPQEAFDTPPFVLRDRSRPKPA